MSTKVIFLKQNPLTSFSYFGLLAGCWLFIYIQQKFITMETIIDNTLFEKQEQVIVFGKFWPRFWALMIDGLVTVPLILVANFYNLASWRSLPLIIVGSLAIFFYRPLMEFYYGATVGKMALKMKVVNTQFEKLSWSNVFLRNIFGLLGTLLQIMGYVYLFNLPGFEFVDSFQSYSNFSNQSGMIWFSILPGLMVIVDAIYFLSNEKCRALHDIIGSTYVIRTRQ